MKLFFFATVERSQLILAKLGVTSDRENPVALKLAFKNQWVGGFRFTYFYGNF